MLLPKNGVAISVGEQVLMDNQVADVCNEHLVGDLVWAQGVGLHLSECHEANHVFGDK